MNEQGKNFKETDNAIATLYRAGMLARSDEEEELLDWFRMLPENAKQIELARAQGMAQVMRYERMKGA